MQLAAAISADGDQGQISGKFPGVIDPRRAQRNVHQTRAIAHQILDRLVSGETILEKLAALIEDLAEDYGGELTLFEGGRHCREIRPVGDLIQELAVGVQVAGTPEAAAAADASTLAGNVSTS